MTLATNTWIRQIIGAVVIFIIILQWLFLYIIYPLPIVLAKNEILGKMVRLPTKEIKERHNMTGHYAELQQFNQKATSINHTNINGFKDYKQNSGINGVTKGLVSTFKTPLLNVSWTKDSTVESISDASPHFEKDNTSILNSFKWSKRRTKASMVIGIPTVKRQGGSYLKATLNSIFDNISDDEARDILVILMIAEPDDFEYINITTRAIKHSFSKQLNQGILEIIVPPPSFYPDLKKLKITLGNEKERVHWRSKQNLDYAFLMMYAQKRGSSYYIQLEDDILVSVIYYIIYS